MQSYQPAVFARDDTLFGICQALGEDFGFDPFWLRLTLSAMLIWNPVAVIGGYAAAGAVVVLSRLISPNPRIAVAEWDGESGAVPARPEGDNDAEALAVAA